MKAVVLLGFPATRTEFDQLISDHGGGDFLRAHVRARGAGPLWAGNYVKIVDALQALIDEVGPQVRVVRGATLRNLREASETADVLVVFAHWKGALYVEDDIHLPLDDLLSAARRRGDNASLQVAAQLAQITSAGKHAPASIARSLNALITPRISPLDQALPKNAMRYPVRMQRALRRDLVDEVLEALVEHGNSLEFFDGLHPPGCVEGAVTPGFCGTLELATCHSDLLALYFDRARDDRIRLLQNDRALLPVPRCHIVRHALAYVLRHPDADYAQTRLAFERGLAKAILKRPRRKGGNT
jgi:hypothetical protein